MTSDLFQSTMMANYPLAEALRPSNLKDFFGQPHLFEPNHPISLFINKKFCPGFIIHGPPGSGKTTLANLIGKLSGLNLILLSAVHSGKKDLAQAIDQAKETTSLYKQGTLLFIDEIHRYNKLQQDGLLEAIEKGYIHLIGATTENPSIEINKALLSRLQIIHLDKIDPESMRKIIIRALHFSCPEGEDEYYSLDEPLINRLVMLADGDARKAIGVVELLIKGASDSTEKTSKVFTIDDLNSTITSKSGYSISGDDRYELVSALIKSIRGSDVNAALVYLAKMLNEGEEPPYIARRLVILASEDIGNADPQAAILAGSLLSSIERTGMPEARILLSQLVTYLSLSPKSNKSYIAIEKALAEVRDNSFSIPLKLINPLSASDREQGKGKGYIYPHNLKHHFHPDSYMPLEFKDKIFYEPSDIGFEKTLKERLQWFNKQRTTYNQQHDT